MTSRTRFCWILPPLQVSLAALFGGFGLSQRNKILSHDYLFGIGWDTTLRFHVWPWPFKFAVVTNAPAFLCWALIGWPLGDRWPKASEMVMAAPSLLLIALLWLAVGRWIDRHWASSIRLAWGSLLGFTLICAAGASVPSTTFYLFWGVLVWIVVGCRMAFVVMKRVLILFLVLMTAPVHSQTAIQRRTCGGVIHGIVFDPSGERAKGIRVQAWPIGVGLSGNLPSVETDRDGSYRFEHVCAGTYTVVVNDEKVAYRHPSPMLNQFLYGSPITQVILAVTSPDADLPVYVQPKPGLMQVRITNRETKAEVWKFRVTLKVPGQRSAPDMSFLFDNTVTDHEIEIPPDKDVILHVTADGFHEWSESAGEGELIRVPSGTKTTLEPELEPLK